MKKLISLLLALTMVFALAACGAKEPVKDPTDGGSSETKPALTGSAEDLLGQVIDIQPVEFMGGSMTLDLSDTSEDGLWAIKSYTGLENADSIQEAAFFEPMIGSIPFSMVMVRVKEGVDTKTVAEAMKSGVDPRKWICVEADDMQVCGYGDVVMLIMVGSSGDMTSQSYVDAFKSVCNGELDFVI